MLGGTITLLIIAYCPDDYIDELLCDLDALDSRMIHCMQCDITLRLCLIRAISLAFCACYGISSRTSAAHLCIYVSSKGAPI